MEKKKLLFGLIEMNKTMFNILYTLLCVCVLLSITILSHFGLQALKTEKIITEVKTIDLVIINAIIIFIAIQITSKKHYA